MRMTEETYNKLNLLMAECFDGNAVIDNLAYNLDFYYFNEIADIVHHQIAHILPEWADMISNKMLELSARPIRLDIGGYQDDISNLTEIFTILYNTIRKILEDTRSLIATADMNGDDEVRIFAESFLEKVSSYVKQGEEWVNSSKTLTPAEMNIHIKQYTHFIKL